MEDILINWTPQETRVAVVENGSLSSTLVSGERALPQLLPQLLNLRERHLIMIGTTPKNFRSTTGTVRTTGVETAGSRLGSSWCTTPTRANASGSRASIHRELVTRRDPCSRLRRGHRVN